MPTARTDQPTPNVDLSDIVAALGPQGVLVLIALTVVLLGSSPRIRKAVSASLKALFRELRTLLIIRMGATRKIARRLHRDSWDTMCAHRGLTGLKRGHIRRTPYGIAVHVRMTGSLTSEIVSGKIKQIETGLGTRHNTVRLLPARHADRAVIAITLRNPLSVSVPWPGHPSRDIRKPIALGRTENGDKVTVKGLQRFVIAGTSGAGKSVFLRIIGSAVVTSKNARLSYVDLKAVEASLWARIPGVDVATTPDQVRSMVDRIADRMRTRLHAMAQRGDVDHVPTAQEPAEVIIVDEGAELKRSGLDDVVKQMESLAQLGRAASFWIVWASQYPTDKSGGLPVGIGTQAEAVVGLRVESARINRNVFGEDAGGTGWSADTLPGGGGWFMLRDPDHTQPIPCRAYFLDTDHIRSLTPRTVHRTAVSRTIPPLPAQAPTCHLATAQETAQSPAVSIRKTPSGRADIKLTVADEVRICLAVSPVPIGNNEIARQTGRSKGAVSKTIAKMIDDGEVTADQDKKYTVVLAANRADHKEGNES